MEQDKKYYTPQPEELHTGYKLEMKCSGGTFEVPIEMWKPIIVTDIYEYDIKILCTGGDLRTKYLTKEDIEECGWTDVREVEAWNNREPAYHIGARLKNAMLGYNEKDHSLVITFRDPTISIDGTKDEYEYPHTKNGQFRGICKSINELRKIMEWIGVSTSK